MSTIVHDELMDSLAELRQALPSMRLGQLIANMATVARGAVGGAIWEMEDGELLCAIRWQLEQLSPRPRAEAEQGGAPDCAGVPPSPLPTATEPPRQVN
jgi:hypothetical protein